MLNAAKMILSQRRSDSKKRGLKMTISELRKRSNDFVARLNEIIAEVVDFNNELEDLNREQLRDNRKVDDTPITPDYSPLYAEYKRTFHPQSYADGRVNLFLYGNLYKSLSIKSWGQEYYITSDVDYFGKLQRKYGEFTGISKRNQPAAQRIVGELLGQKYQQMVLS